MATIDLTGRKALVTGGAQGLGEGMARALAAAGARVVIADVKAQGEAVAQDLGPDHGFVQLDVTDDAGWESAIGSTVEQLGGLDILVNNAGVEISSQESGSLGYGVRVNCLYPGLVPTEMGSGLANDVAQMGLFPSPEAAVEAVVSLTPSGRLGTVEDMADAVVFLASDQARFITGAGLPVDGGMGM